MHVEVNEANIDRFGLVEFTGNSREEMLSRAAEAAEAGHVLSVDVPDDRVLEQNVFDVYESESVDVRRLKCHYEKLSNDGGKTYVVMCTLHNEMSQYDVEADPDKPCLVVEPKNSEPQTDVRTCSYITTYNGLRGTVARTCFIHAKVSKHDLEANPDAPCIAVDPA